MRAGALRHSSTDAEKRLWFQLRNRRLLGLKFRRQHPIGPYFADFACVEIGLDGGQHGEQEAYDGKRARVMRALGFRTLRFWNHEVLVEMEGVMVRIREVAIALTPALSRERERE